MSLEGTKLLQVKNYKFVSYISLIILSSSLCTASRFLNFAVLSVVLGPAALALRELVRKAEY